MKKCELCGGLARMRCESDQANLCWDCDVKVHGANFLVAKHSRTLFCHVCQNPTPWLASGHNLSPAVSVCESCVGNDMKNKNNDGKQVITQQEESSEDEFEEEVEDYEDDEEEEEEEVEDGENQVVPWSGDSSSLSLSKPVAGSDSSSSIEGGVGGGGGGCYGGLKRMRDNLSFYSDDEIGCSSSHVGSRGSSNGEATSMGPSRLLKQRRLCEVNQLAGNHDHGEAEPTPTAIISSLKSLQNHMITNDDDASATIVGICRLSRYQSR
ncbi:hypothetical protein DITRI_Ditri14bG0124000 [Diplodiscus trichospermus]